MQVINTMNMSASILRNLVAKCLGIKATSIILSGEISVNAKFSSNTCWSSQTTEYSYEMWGFCPKQGLVKLSHYLGHYQNHNDGSASITEPVELCDIPNVDNYIFFIIKEEVRAYDEQNNSLTYKLFKAPDFKSHWAAIEQSDIERWNNWLNNED